MDVPPTVQDEQAVSRQLHSLSVRNLAHLAAALTQLGFELSRSSDPGTRQAANAFIGQLANINQDIDRQIELLGAGRRQRGVSPAGRGAIPGCARMSRRQEHAKSGGGVRAESGSLPAWR